MSDAQPPPMPPETGPAAERARRAVERRLGRALAEKATPALCLAMEPVARAPFALAEAVGDSARAMNAVIEFTPPAGEEASTAASAVRASDEQWAQLERAIAALPSDGHRQMRADDLLRAVNIEAMRTGFYRRAGAVYGEIERAAGGLMRGDANLPDGPTLSASLTQVCWLNGTVRSHADTRVLAEVAADDEIQRIDVPQPLIAEIDRTGPLVGAVDVHGRLGARGRNVLVAVLDSEVSLSHPALAGRVIHRRNYTAEPWGNPGAHGTAVAGIIASDDVRLLGMAPEATIYNYKVLATNRFLNGDDFGGALALQQALEDGMHVANCSWGVGPARDGISREARACDAAWGLGLVIVKSAGNAGPGPSTLTSPADADGIIVVGATDVAVTGVQAYSSRGPTGHGRSRPHLVAPGGSPGTGMHSCEVGGGMGVVGHGTSYAAPHVTGLVALLLSDDPRRTPDQVRQTLLDNCVRFVGLDDDTQGRGRISLTQFAQSAAMGRGRSTAAT